MSLIEDCSETYRTTYDEIFTVDLVGWITFRAKILQKSVRQILSYFTFKNGIWIVRSKRHVTSTRDVSLCVRDSSTSSLSSSIISSSEILLSWRNYSIQISWLFLKLWISPQWQGVNNPERTNKQTDVRAQLIRFQLLTIFEGKIAQLFAFVNSTIFIVRNSNFWIVYLKR